jgi:hypothetical protein
VGPSDQAWPIGQGRQDQDAGAGFLSNASRNLFRTLDRLIICTRNSTTRTRTMIICIITSIARSLDIISLTGRRHAQVYLFSLPIKEYQIMDHFFGTALKDEVSPRLRRHLCGVWCLSLSVFVCVCVCLGA